MARVREPAVPNRGDGATNRRHVILVREHRVALLRNTQARKFGGKVGEARHLDGGDVVVVAVIIAVGTDAVSDAADLPGDVAEILVKTLPLRGNAGAGFP